MAYLQIKSFKFGVDTRKSELTSQLGSLVTCQNAHINQGGEVEKRQTFKSLIWNLVPNAENAALSALEVTQFGVTLFTKNKVVMTGTPGGNPFLFNFGTSKYSGFLALLPDPLLPPSLPQNVSAVDIIATCPFAGGAFILVKANDSQVYGFYLQYIGGVMKMTWAVSSGANTIAADGNFVQVDSHGNNYTFYYVTTSVLPGINSATTCFNYKSKVYICTNPILYFCAVADPLHWTTGTGSGNITVTNWDFTAQPLLAGRPYQQYLALFTSDTAQTWNIPADPTQFSQVQIFQNTGTVDGKSVFQLGDLDVMFVNASGIRSLRVRDSSLNAYVNDMGSPIDDLVQGSLASVGNLPQTIIAAVEPLGGRYWCFINGVVYVLSYFPSIKIVAWSTYDLTLKVAIDVQGNAGYVPLVPLKFVVYQNTLFFLSTYFGVGDPNPTYVVVAYGNNGVNNSWAGSYSDEPVTFETPWLDAGKPGTKKTSQGFDAVFFGKWTFYVATNYLDDPAIVTGAPGIQWRKVVSTTAKPTPNGLFFPMQGVSTHVKFKAVSVDPVQATLSSIMWHYTDSGEKP